MSAKAMTSRAQFVFVDRSLRGTGRAVVVGVLLAAGLVVQVVLASPIWGGVLVLVGSVLTWLRGVHIKPAQPRKREWREVAEQQFLEVQVHHERITRWTRHWLNIHSGRGGCGFVLALVLGAGVTVGLMILPGDPLAPERARALPMIWAIDYGLFVVAVWLSGRRTAWMPEDLLLRVECLAPMIGLARQNAMLFEPRPMLELAMYADEKRPPVPHDARVMIRLKKAADWFIGVQVQVSINRVQAKPYPYLYCVLLAKKGHDLAKRVMAEGVRGLAPADTTIEHQEEKDVDVVVVRQHTTRTSGYHTKAAVRYQLVQGSLSMAVAVAQVKEADVV